MLQKDFISLATTVIDDSQFVNKNREHITPQTDVDGVVHAMELVVETRDPHNTRHQRRVAELARAIAREMCLSEWHVKGIHITGLLHDIGKLTVPAEILVKPGKLSWHEIGIIRNHPHVGYEILEKIEFPWPVAQTILQHHERMNGSGYPKGLSGVDIIIEARVLAVADVVEAMSSHRPYRPALGLDCALEEISQRKEIVYDSEVVDACVGLFQNDTSKFDSLMEIAAKR